VSGTPGGGLALDAANGVCSIASANAGAAGSLSAFVRHDQHGVAHGCGLAQDIARERRRRYDRVTLPRPRRYREGDASVFDRQDVERWLQLLRLVAYQPCDLRQD
jgi:hypothetical protein